MHSVQRNLLEFLLLCNKKALKQGICVHSPIVKLGLQDQLYLNNNLLSFYAKCVGVDHARYLFDEMPQRDVVSWTGIMSAYKTNGNHEEVLDIFDSMVVSGEDHPNAFTFSTALQSCGALRELERGRRIHACVVKHGVESNLFCGCTLVEFYTSCNLTEQAYRVFNNVNNRDTVLWTMMMSCFVQAKQSSQAMRLYPRMVEEGAVPNKFTFVKLLTASSYLGLAYGKMVHALLMRWGIMLELVVKTALADMYLKCENMEDALKVSSQTADYDVFLWTSNISGYAQRSMILEAAAAFHQMRISGIQPNNCSFSAILSACSSVMALDFGEQIHTQVVLAGLEADVCVCNALIDLYMKFSDTIVSASNVFKGIAVPNIISWTSLISGFAKQGLDQKSFQVFGEMQALGLQPNSFTLSGLLQACSRSKSLKQTRELHGYVIKNSEAYDIIVENALVDAYAGSGSLRYAWHVVRTMDHRDVVTYTSLATRMNEMGEQEMALNVIGQMINDDVKMDSLSLASFLSASATLTAKGTGEQLHCYSLKSGLCSWISVCNALVDLYGKCGCVHDVRRAFGEISEPDAVSYNGLIWGLASNGEISAALTAFEDMRLNGVKPDSITFLLLLFACSHSGLVDLGLEYFEDMRETYNVLPELDHYVCLVDLFGRAGRLEEAASLIRSMPFKPDALIYKTLLSACRLHGNIPLGEDIARKGLELEPHDPALYVLLARMYDEYGWFELGEKTRRLMKEKGLRKSVGQSWMEVRNKIHAFTAGDKSHPQITEIHKKIQSLVSELAERGYDYQHSEYSLYHSEKLAVAFGILSTPSTAPIHIFKNIRICTDCHRFIMIVTQLVNREIVVRDVNRFHHFKSGACSCRGYW